MPHSGAGVDAGNVIGGFDGGFSLDRGAIRVNRYRLIVFIAFFFIDFRKILRNNTRNQYYRYFQVFWDELTSVLTSA